MTEAPENSFNTPNLSFTSIDVENLTNPAKPPPPRIHAANTYNNGVKAALSGDKQMGYRMIASSVDIDPTFREGWYAIGNANGDLMLLAASVACMRRLLEIDSNDVKALVNMGWRLHHLGWVEEAKKTAERALALDDKDPHALANLAMAESVLGNNKKSLSLARRAFEICQEPVIELQLAFSLLYDEKWIEGLRHFESRFPYKLNAFGNYQYYPYQRWQGQEVETLLVVADQGMGDSLCYLRFIAATAARVKTLILNIHPETVRLFRAILQDIENVQIVPMPHPFPLADAWEPIVSLPVTLGLTDEQFESAPWPRMPGFKLPAPWTVPERKLHIGIAWAGNAINDIDRWRSMDVQNFLDLYRVPGIQLYSLQVGQHVEDLHKAGCAALIKDLSPYIHDAADTIAIINELDMVITIESFVAWLAAAADKECWVAYSRMGGDYRFGRNRLSPIWASRTRIFKQDKGADWKAVFGRIVEALKERVR